MAEQSIVERVAKALCASYAAPHESPDLFWKGNEENHRRSARAAIEAMRQSTEEMREAGFQFTGDPCWPEDVGKAWEAMIDTALKE